jgi:hypothetical protein
VLVTWKTAKDGSGTILRFLVKAAVCNLLPGSMNTIIPPCAASVAEWPKCYWTSPGK